MNDTCEYKRICRAAEYIKSLDGYFRPEICVVLGSGLGGYADSEHADVKLAVPYSEIPDFPVSTVSGHEGRFIFAHIKGAPVLLMQGRVHMYEGYSACESVMPVRIARMAGAGTIILTNAAGGINRGLKPGDFMIIRDHISSFVPSPLNGANIDELGERFPDMTHVYSNELSDIAACCAHENGIDVKYGTYVQLPGPQYETPAEIRMLSILGADAVGMSTATEAIAARHMGADICGISCITNMAAGIDKCELSHEDVKLTAGRVSKDFETLITSVIESLNRRHTRKN